MPDTLPRTALGWACLGLIVAAACWLVARSLRWVTTNFVITTQRVIDRWGVLSKHSTEIPLERVNTVMSSQGIFERLFGVGDLVIESGGEAGQQRFADIRNPNRVKGVLHGLVHERQHATDQRTNGTRRRATWRINSRSSKACCGAARSPRTSSMPRSSACSNSSDVRVAPHRQPRPVGHRDPARARRPGHGVHPLL